MNLKPSEVAYLRNEKGLPYVKLSIRKRIYLEDDLMAWFRTKRVVSDPVSLDTP
jgi:hypothetical protein